MPSMKISRTSLPHQPSTTGKAPGVGGPSGKGFTAKLGAAKAESVSKGALAASKSEKASRAAQSSIAVSDIGADLKAGKLTPQAAIDKVIERVLDRQVGRKAGAAVREKLSAALRESLADDPMLAAKVRALAEE
jgi:hypothetical protein